MPVTHADVRGAGRSEQIFADRSPASQLGLPVAYRCSFCKLDPSECCGLGTLPVKG